MAARRSRHRPRRVPPQHLRATRGPRAPDAIVGALQALVREEFRLRVLPRVLAELARAGAIPGPARRDASITFGWVGSLMTERLRAALRSGAHAVARSAIAGVRRTLSPERSTRISGILDTEGRLIAGYLERVESSVLGNRLVAELERVFAGDLPDREQLTRAVEVTGESAAAAIKAETQQLHGELVGAASRAAGLTKYVWTTQLDEVVREGHAELEGTIQLWSDPPVTDETGYRAHPGEPRNCRCTAWPWDDGES